jgi:thiamine kinase-like enzyme
MSHDPDQDVLEQINAALGQPIVAWSTQHGGLTHASTRLATLADGTSAFVKAATNDHSAVEITNEIAFLDALDAPFLPRRLGEVRGSRPALILEDLSGGHWPEPYPDNLSGLADVLEAIRQTPIPVDLELPRLEGPIDEMYAELVDNAGRAAPVLARWVEEHADAIGAAASHREDDALVHGDLWYSNLCFLPDRVVVVDWSHARCGSRWFDASTVGIDLVIGGRRPLPMEEAAAWAADHLVWTLWGLAEGPWPSIADTSRWRLDNLELVDGAAWWLAHELELPAPPVLTDRSPGWT